MALLYRLDSRLPGTLWSDTGKTTLVSNGGTVAVWTPSGGSITDDTTQSTAANRPTYRANYSSSGYPGVEFDGSNDLMSAVDAAGWDVSAITVICAARIAVATGDRLVAHKWHNGNWNDGWGVVLSGTRYCGMVNTWNPVGPPLVTGPALMWIRTTGSGGYKDAAYNGTGAGSNASVTIPTNANAFTIGSGSVGYPFSGAIHYVAVYDSALSNSDLDAALYDLDQAFGLGQYAVRSAGRPSLPFLQQVIG